MLNTMNCMPVILCSWYVYHQFPVRLVQMVYKYYESEACLQIAFPLQSKGKLSRMQHPLFKTKIQSAKPNMSSRIIES